MRELAREDKDIQITAAGIADTSADMRARWKEKGHLMSALKAADGCDPSNFPVNLDEGMPDQDADDVDSWQVLDEYGNEISFNESGNDLRADELGVDRGESPGSDLQLDCLEVATASSVVAPSADIPGKRFKFSLVDVEGVNADSTSASCSSAANRGPLPQSSFLVSEAVRLSDTQQFLFPWEKGRLKTFFNKGPNDRLDNLPKLRQSDDNFLKLKLKVDANVQVSAALEVEMPTATGTVYTSVVKAMIGESYLDERVARRGHAVKMWAELLSMDWLASGPGVTVKYECGSGDPIKYCCELLDAVFGLKSPNTLLKRLYGIKAYSSWLLEMGMGNWLPFTEYAAWQYLCHLKESEAPPTRGTSFLEAVRFCHFVVNVEGAMQVLESGRIKGRASQLFARKRPWQPADPLTTSEVVSLHQALEDERRNVVDRVIIGHIIHMIYARARFSDMLAVQGLSLDEESMFLELQAALHKGARGADARARLLPIVAPANGISGKNWAEIYLRLRDECGLEKPSTDPIPMLPAPSKSGSDSWCKRYLTSSELNGFIRVFFQKSLADTPTRRLSSHSMKATGMSWSAKFGVGPDTRAILARHASAAHGATVLYSRDIISAAMREFTGVINQIRSSLFHPDRTRGGMLTPPPATPNAAAFPTTPTLTFPSAVRPDEQQQTSFESGPSAAQTDQDDVGSFVPSPSTIFSPGHEDVKEELFHGDLFDPNEVIAVEDGVNLLEDWDPESDLEDDEFSSTESESSDDSELQPKPSEVRQTRPVPLSGLYINCKSLVIHALKGPQKFRCGRPLSQSYEAVAEPNGLKCGKCFVD